MLPYTGKGNSGLLLLSSQPEFSKCITGPYNQQEDTAGWVLKRGSSQALVQRCRTAEHTRGSAQEYNLFLQATEICFP